MIPGTPPRDPRVKPAKDYSLQAEDVEGHLRNCLSLLDSDNRSGFWERRRTTHAIRARLRAALDLLEARTP